MKPTRTLLLVDDSENDLLLVETALEKAQFVCRLSKVQDGDQAIAYLKGAGEFANREQHPLPSAVLLDLNMPVKNGFEVLEWVRRHHEFRHIPFIVLTASLRVEDVQRAEDIGANAFLVKPASLDELVSMFRCLAEWLRINHFPPKNEWVRR